MAVDAMKFLQNVALFQGLSKTNMAALAGICIPKNYNKGEVLFHEEEEGHAIYLAVFGKIQLHKISSQGKQLVVKVVQSGELFAEVVLLEAAHYPVTAIALEAGMVFMLSTFQFHCLLEDKGFRNEFISLLLRRQRYLVEQLQSMTSFSLAQRLFMFLKGQYGKKTAMSVDMSKKQIAHAIGTSPESLSRLITKLQQQGVFQWTKKRITFQSSFWEEWERIPSLFEAED